MTAFSSFVRIESARIAARRARQSARHLSRRRQAAADRRHGPNIGVRRGAARRDSRQRHRTHGDLELLVREARERHPNHLTGTDPTTCSPTPRDRAVVKNRAVVVHKLKPLPVEAVVRGYLIGSGWKDYCKTGRVSGVALPHRARARGAPAGADLHAEHQSRARQARREHLDGRRERPARRGARAPGE